MKCLLTGNEAAKDHFVFHQLSAIQSMIKSCDLIIDTSREKEMSEMLSCVETLLLHPHTWVRIVSSQIFALSFSTWGPADKPPMNKKSLYFHELETKMKLLGISFCQQIQSEELDQKLAEQCVRNLVFVIRTLHARDVPSEGEEVFEKNAKSPATFLLMRLLKVCKQEAADNIKETDRRTAVLKLYAALSVKVENLTKFLPFIVELVYRETERSVGKFLVIIGII